MRISMLPLFLLCAAASAAVKDADWCTIETPDTATPGTPIEVKITLKAGAAKEGEKLANHLQWMKKDGFGGMLSWVPAKNAKNEETFVFKHSPKLDAKMHTISPLVFLSPDGDFKHVTKRATGASIRVVMDPVADAAAVAVAEQRKRPETATLKNSSMSIKSNSKQVGVGDEFEIAVHYKLDPKDNWGDGTKIQLTPLGPWIDNPDGKYTKTRQHVGYPGLSTRTVSVTPGEDTQIFKFKLGKAFKYNDIHWMATFVGGDGKNWPWSVRGGSFEILRSLAHFDLTVSRPGGLFTYDETPVVNVLWNKGAKAGTPRTIAFTVTNADGKPVGAFTRDVVSGAPGEATEVALEGIKARGVLLVEAKIDGIGTRDAFIARIPDLPTILGNRSTPFGATNISGPEASSVARKIGLTYCRQFVNWNEIEPLPGQWELAGLQKTIEANNAAGLTPWICLVKPPSWIIPGNIYGAGFEPFPFLEEEWKRSATTLAKTFSGKIWGFEWLNEIVPGTKSADPSKDYINFCDIGTRAVKAVDPSFKIQMAGGLWPRNFRTDLLNGGIGSSIDVLPVHYSNRGGVLEAIQDASASGSSNMSVWDNESAAGLSVWNMPALDALTNSIMQAKWVLRNWPGELAAGAEAVIYFGGEPQSAGNWSYLLDDTTPRPVVASLAVMASKIGLARPVGTVAIEPNAVLHIFEKDGRGIAVASTIADTPGSTPLWLKTNAKTILATDYQGNETSIQTQAGVLWADIDSMPIFLEGFDFPTLAAYVGFSIGTQDSATLLPSIMATLGSEATLPVRINNPLSETVTGAIELNLGGTVGTLPPHTFTLKASESSWIKIPISADQLAGIGTNRTSVVLTWNTPYPAKVIKSFKIVTVEPASLGNLLKNGDMEEADGSKPAAWGGNAERFDLASLGTGPGFDGHAARFTGEKSQSYQHMGQGVKLPAPGRKYLYTAWIWNDDMQAGSNLSVDDKTYYIPAVFDAGKSTKFWRLMTHVRDTPDSAKSMSPTPVVRGKGWAMVDNVRISLYDGTDYATEAHRAKKPIRVDGNLSDWDLSDPIPLLCDNQITAPEGYNWTPANLSGIAKFTWDNDALYFAAQVRDDKSVANTTGEETINGDSLVIALHPGNRVEGTDGQAFAWYVGAGSPGGGSGVNTLYRSPKHSGGLASGQLAKDSSVYELSIKREGDITTYELRIPWAETGGLSPSVGIKAGLSLQLFDSDGAGQPAVMTWGGGLRPTWSPTGFGALTLTD